MNLTLFSSDKSNILIAFAFVLFDSFINNKVGRQSLEILYRLKFEGTLNYPRMNLLHSINVCKKEMKTKRRRGGDVLMLMLTLA